MAISENDSKPLEHIQEDDDDCFSIGVKTVEQSEVPESATTEENKATPTTQKKKKSKGQKKSNLDANLAAAAEPGNSDA
jgi:hypothetical protein